MASTGTTPAVATGKEEDYFIGVSGLPPRFKWQDLKDHIRRITPRIGANSVHVPVLPTGQSQGIGIVRIRGQEEAEKVYGFLSTHPCDGAMLQVKMCPASATTQSPPNATCPPPLNAINATAFSPVSQHSINTFHSETANSFYIVNSPMESAPLAMAMNSSDVNLSRTSYYGPQYATPSLSPSNFTLQPSMLGHPFPHRMAEVPYVTPQPMIMPPATFPYLFPNPAYSAGISGPIYTSTTEGTPINVSYGAVRTEITSVFIGNLSYEAKWEDVRNLVRRVGTIQRCHLITDSKTGRSRGCATVSFRTMQEAETAISTFNETTFMNRKIIVRADKEASNMKTRSRARGSSQGAMYPHGKQPVIANGSTALGQQPGLPTTK